MTEMRCGNCRYFMKSGCHHEAPRVNPPYRHAKWPEVFEDDWCGKWRPFIRGEGSEVEFADEIQNDPPHPRTLKGTAETHIKIMERLGRSIDIDASSE